MSIKHLILLAALAVNIFVSAQSDTYRVELLEPQGFRVYRFDKYHSLRAISFDGSINQALGGSGTAGETIVGYFHRRSDGWWVYQNTATYLQPGDTLYYNVFETTEMSVMLYNFEFRVPVIVPPVPA